MLGDDDQICGALDLGLHDDDTIFVHVCGAKGGARSDKEEIDASDTDEEEQKEQDENPDDDVDVSDSRAAIPGRKVPCLTRKKRGRKRKIIDIATGNRARKRRKKENAQRQANRDPDWNADIWMQKLFPKPSAKKRFQCRMYNGLDGLDETAKRLKERHIGTTDPQCPHCRALLFKHELSDKPKQTCRNKVRQQESQQDKRCVTTNLSESYKMLRQTDRQATTK